ncbi:hypothetical protein [Ruminococcus sp.]|uniref:hypothetical protein n=1 Tax=Ruminococcus sp. TaxID=41978 RepID=UPI0026015722|nr:hypothetical protein [Ruminococcus sp.]
MEIVGYNKEYVFTDHLNEATITCTYDELKNIVSFLDEVVKKCDNEKSNCCVHLRDYLKEWDKSFSDLIILIP